MRYWKLALFAVLASRAHAAGGVSTVSLSLNQIPSAPRWMFDSKAKVKGNALIQHLVEAKKALIAKNRARCIPALLKSYHLGKSLGPWIAWNHLQCAVLPDKHGHLSIPVLKQAVAVVEAQPKWMLYGPSVSALKDAYVEAMMALAENQVKSDRRLAWGTIDKLLQMKSWLTREEMANVFHWAGELAFIEQNLPAALSFLNRSLDEKDDPEVRTRVEAIRSSLLGKKNESGQAAVSPNPGATSGNQDLGISDEERDIYTRMNRAYDSQDYVSAIEDGVELIRKFPGSRRASQAADRVQDIYLSLSNRDEEKYRHVRDSIVKEMLKVDAGRLSRWAQNAYARGNYIDALNLAESAFNKYAGQSEATKILLLAGKAALASGSYDDAKSHFEQLVTEDGGTAEAVEATFRLGLLEFRNKRYPQAAAFFERLLALPNSGDYEYRARYWQWRAQQKIDPSKSDSFAKPLIAKFPLSYYGLRARAELNHGILELPDQKVRTKIDMRLMESERLAWERFSVLIKAGWLKEAAKELDFLPDPQTDEERLVRAKLWGSALRYDNAIQLVNQAMDDDPSLLQRSLLKIVFPEEYSAFITKQSKATGLDADWILSLIRQESSFRPDVKSPSNAMGVMQLLFPTGQELARDFRVKNFTSDSLLDPEINIKLGAAYLARLVKNFSGNIPLALAAYNAGPTRLRRWLNSRKDLSPLETSNSSSPDVEVWIDELPWEETSFYVKAILRNRLIYKVLDESKLSLSEPIWVDAKSQAR